MKLTIVALLPLLFMVGSGCASIVGGTDQLISVDSNVKGADVFFNGAKVGTTPFSGKIKKAKEPALMVSKDGYEPKQQVLSTTTPTIFWGNIIIGGTIGSSTDYATGAMFEISPANYYVNLEPQKPSSRYDYEKDTEIKKYSMINYSNLSKQISQNSGEHLEGLLKIMSVRATDRAATLVKLDDLVRKSNGNPVQFGEGVTEYYFRL